MSKQQQPFANSTVSSKSRRDARLAEQRRQNEQRNRRRRTLIALGIVAGVALVIVAGSALLSMRGSSQADVPIAGLQQFEVSASHTSAPVTYPQTPPAGGPHAPVWQNCGFYDAPIANETGVHALEHGAVWITYRPELLAQNRDALRRLASTTYILVSPYEGLPAPVVASAWGLKVQLDSLDDPRLQQFIRAYRVGPQTPEPGAPCTGGTGTPV